VSAANSVNALSRRSLLLLLLLLLPSYLSLLL